MDTTSFFSENSYPPHQFRTKSIGQIYNEFKTEDIIVHPCQREFVWGKSQKQKFLTTISKRGPVSGPQFNRNLDSRSEIMDGQNRIRTIIEFMDDDFQFENEQGIKLTYSQLTDTEKRSFRNIHIGYTETTEWTNEQCEENFCEIQEGMPLTPGEKINSSTTNPVTLASKDISDTLGLFVTKPVTECGMNLKTIRYKHLEVFSTLLDMVLRDTFPQKEGKTSITLYDLFKTTENRTQLDRAKNTVINVCNTYQTLVNAIPELQRGANRSEDWQSAVGVSHLLRSLYFIFKRRLYLEEITQIQILKFRNMIVRTHLLNSAESKQLWDRMKIMAQNNSDEIYETYLRFYNENIPN